MIFTALPGGFHFTKVDPGGQKQDRRVRIGLEFKLTSESQAPHPFSHTVRPLCIPQLGTQNQDFSYFTIELVNKDIQPPHRPNTDSCWTPSPVGIN